MYAILETGSKQYKVSPGDLLRVEKLHAEAGSEAILRPLLLVFDKELHVGNPYLPKAGLICDVIRTERDSKITIFKHKRRKGHRRKKGHRQYFTVVKVKEIKLVAPDGALAPKKETASAKKITKSPVKKTKKIATRKKSGT